jgi:hypothetical protein
MGTFPSLEAHRSTPYAYTIGKSPVVDREWRVRLRLRSHVVSREVAEHKPLIDTIGHSVGTTRGLQPLVCEPRIILRRFEQAHEPLH